MRACSLGLMIAWITLVSLLSPVTLVSLKPRALVSLKPRALVSLKPRALVSLKPRALVSLKPRALCVVCSNVRVFLRKHFLSLSLHLLQGTVQDGSMLHTHHALQRDDPFILVGVVLVALVG